MNIRRSRSPPQQWIVTSENSNATSARRSGPRAAASYFHSATGDIVTQLPHTSGWYTETTQQIDKEDFIFGGVTCMTS